MIVINIESFKEAYRKATGASTDNVQTAIIYYLDGDDYTVIPDGVRIVDMYNLLYEYHAEVMPEVKHQTNDPKDSAGSGKLHRLLVNRAMEEGK